MLKILIVDDEALARQDIASRIRWEQLDCSIIGFAGDGLRALDIIKKQRPEIVLIDIKMPIMNGLEVIEKTLEEGINCSFVVLSCFEDYELVRRALKLGAIDYLLKHTYTSEDLLNVINKAKNILEGKRSDQYLRNCVRALAWKSFIDCLLIESEIDNWINAGILESKETNYAILTLCPIVDHVAVKISNMPALKPTVIINDMNAKRTFFVLEGADETCLSNGIRNIGSIVADLYPKHSLCVHQCLNTDIRDLYNQHCMLENQHHSIVSRKTQMAIDYMQKFCSQKIVLEAVANSIGISKVYLSQVFKNDTGRTFSEYLCEYRLQKACDLLLNTNLKIYEIATQVGFSGQAYFSVTFKRVFGISPYEFRERTPLNQL